MTDDQWTPLSDRDAPTVRAMRDGVPASLEIPLREWVRTTAERDTSAAGRAAVRIDVVLYTEESGHEDVGPGERLAYWTPAEKLLDVTDALLDLLPTGGWQNTPLTAGLSKWQAALIAANSLPDTQYRVPLQRLLNDASSLYTIRDDGRALVRRVDSAVVAVTNAAAKAADQPERGSATRHLRQAFDAAYALQPDPAKAYSEAIKAVESAAHSTLQPKHAKATLGTMLGEFRQVQAKLGVPIAGKTGTEGLTVVESMMDLLWTGQTSRHGNLQETRDETVQEAIMAVHLASTLVQLFASGAIQRS
ncbi:hypothetical protein ACFV5G_36215 [Streptomyces sp. NPDC059766]|uniref:hypothetical protein n=1 Tax=Streptomyces sp. NPDC059766 TaxID=3346940 RepID=UPI0036551D97